jgi:hypothetical protein
VAADLAVGDLIEFRLTRDGGTLIDTYAVTPSILMAEPIARAKVVRGPFPFPKSTPDFLPSPQGPTSAGLTGSEAASALGALAATIAITLAGVQGTGAVGIGPTDVTVGLSGVSATSAIGSVTQEDAPILSGLSATGSLGTLGLTFTVPLSGVAGTGATGTLTPTTGNVIDLSGVGGTGAVGTLGLTGDVGLSGSQGTSALGSLSASSDTALVIQRPRVVRGPFPFPKTAPSFQMASATSAGLTGVEASSDEGNLGVSVSIGLTGIAATSGQGLLQPTQPGTGVLVGVQGTSGTGTLTPVLTFPLSGFQATSAVGTMVALPNVIDRPHGIHGPFPFLAGTEFQFRQRRRLVNPVSQSITVILNGVSATGQIGSIAAKTVDRGLTGQSASGATGTLPPSTTVATSGVSATGALGSLGIGQGLSGVQATGNTGAVTPAISVDLTGVSASSGLGTIAAQSDGNITATLTGHQVTGQTGTMTPAITVALSGVAASTAIGTPQGSVNRGLTGTSGNTATGALGLVGNGEAALSGVSATASLASVTPGIAALATVVPLTTQVGNVSLEPITFELVGVQGTAGTGVINRRDPLVVVFSRDKLRQALVFIDEDLIEG